MKRTIKLSVWIASLLMVSFSACKKEENTLLEDPDLRLNQYLDATMDQLTSAEYGFKASLTTKLENTYFLYMHFGTDGRVTMLSDFTDESAQTAATSSYRLKALQRPTLLFDTYNYLSIFADPQGSVNGGKNGEGLFGDNDFSILSTESDTLFLVGNKNLAILSLVPASQAERDSFLDGALQKSRLQLLSFLNSGGFPFLTDGNKKISIDLNVGQRNITFNSLLDDGMSVKSSSSSYEYQSWGLKFFKPISINDKTIDRLIWDDTQNQYYMLNGNEKVWVEISQNPVFPLALQFGFRKTFTSIGFSGNTLPDGVISGFSTVWESVDSKFKATNRNITAFEFKLISEDEGTVSVNYVSGTSPFVANMSFNYTIENDILTISNPKRDYTNANWTTRIAQLQDLENYILQGPFKIKWVESSNPNNSGLGGLEKVSQPGSYIFGFLK